MEFEITRTSTWRYKKPCEEAYIKEIIEIDERGFETFEEFEDRLKEKWVDKGFNHKIVEANKKFDTPHIYREFNKEIWCIKVNSLEELIDFKNKHGDLILSESFFNDKVNSIEIYDDYRE